MLWNGLFVLFLPSPWWKNILKLYYLEFSKITCLDCFYPHHGWEDFWNSNNLDDLKWLGFYIHYGCVLGDWLCKVCVYSRGAKTCVLGMHCTPYAHQWSFIVDKYDFSSHGALLHIKIGPCTRKSAAHSEIGGQKYFEYPITSWDLPPFPNWI